MAKTVEQSSINRKCPIAVPSSLDRNNSVIYCFCEESTLPPFYALIVAMRASAMQKRTGPEGRRHPDLHQSVPGRPCPPLLSELVEGVETVHQADYFSPGEQKIYVQGWLYGRPMSAQRLIAELAGDRVQVPDNSETDGAFSTKAGKLRIVGASAA